MTRIFWRLLELPMWGGAGVLAGCGYWQGTVEILCCYCGVRVVAEIKNEYDRRLRALIDGRDDD